MEASANQKRSKGNLWYYFHAVVVLVLMFGFGYLPPLEPLTVMGMKIIGIFLGCLYGWVFVELIWPSLLGILAIMLTGFMTAKEALNSSFGDPLVLMLFFILIFCATIDHYGLSQFVSLWFITRKFALGKPWVFTFTFLFAMAILSGLTSAVATSVIGWSILYGICDVLGYQKKDGYSMMMIFGIVYAAQIGMALIPFKNVPLAVIGAYETMSGVTFDYLKYMFIAMICCIVCLILFIIMAKFIFKPDVSKLKELNLEKMNVGGRLTLNNIQKIILVFLFALVTLMVLPSILPKSFFLTKFISGIGNTGVCILLVLVMAAIRVDGKPLLDFKKMVDRGMLWGILVLLAVVQPLSTALTSEETGVTAFLMQMMDPIFSGKSPILFVAFIGLAAVIITNFVNNVAVGVSLMPIVYAYSNAMGFNAEFAVVMVIMSVLLALLTPAASSSAALLHGNDAIDSKYIMKISFITIVLSYLVMAATILIIGSFLF